MNKKTIQSSRCVFTFTNSAVHYTEYKIHILQYKTDDMKHQFDRTIFEKYLKEAMFANKKLTEAINEMKRQLRQDTK